MVTPTLTHIIEIASSSALFIFVWWFLRAKIFIPYVAVIEEREARTVGDAERVRVCEKEREGVQRVIQEELKDARLEGMKRREAKVRAAKEQAQIILEEATRESQQELERSRSAISQLEAQAHREIQSQVPVLAEQIINQIVSSGGTARVVH